MTSPYSTLPSRAVEVALSGEKAASWLLDMGWRASSSRSLQIFADVVRWDPFAVGRIWHTPVELALVGAESWSDDVFIAVFAIDGAQTITSASGEFELAPGEMYVQRLNEMLCIRSSVPAARMVVVSDWASIGLPVPDTSTVAAHDRDYAKVFENAANAVLNLAREPHSAAFTHIRLGLESLLASLLTCDTDTAQVLDERPLLERARRVIEARAYEPGFDIRTLTADLETSRTVLYRAFTSEQSSPAVELRARRTALARMLIARRAPTTQAALGSIAAAAGFGSVKSMQRALVGSVGSVGSVGTAGPAGSLDGDHPSPATATTR